MIKKTEEHNIEVKVLKEIEEQLTKLILDINNDDLMDKYLEWRSQRNVCNEGYISVMDKIIEASTNKTNQNEL